MTFDDFLEMGRLRSKSTKFKEKIERTIDICAQQMIKNKNPYVALSAGKDSVAMAFIVNEGAIMAGKNFRLWTHLSDASFPGTKETAEAVAKRIKRELDLYESPISAFDMIKNPQKTPFGKSGCFYSSIRQYAKDKDLSFVGVRAYESKRRMRAARVHGQCFHSDSMGNVDVCYPLLWFRLDDVAAVLYMFDAPIHPIYKKMCIENNRNSFDEERFIRLNYVTSRDLLNKGTAVFLKLNYPDIYMKLQRVYPEIANYI